MSTSAGWWGRNGGTVTASYTTGSVLGREEADDVGGLVGWNQGTITASYYDRIASGRIFGIGSDDNDNDNTVDSGETNRLPGKSAAELRQPTGYTGIYADWNDLDGDDSVDATTYWDFGLSRQYPALKADFNGDGTATWQEFGPQAASPSDYDADNDGLIEVDSLARLNAMRWDLDGDGISSDAGYLAEYPSSHAVQDRNPGCPSGCVGYELTAGLDFDTNGSGSADSGDDYWNFGVGWQPIGTEASPFNAVFEGNGHAIANLFIDRDVNYNGLFGHAGPSAVIRNQALTGVSVSGRGRVGGLAGRNQGMVIASYATGRVSGNAAEVGGLVGNNLRGSVTASYASARVSGSGNVGGLVGWNQTGAVTASYATGRVSGTTDVGGLVGRNEGSVTLATPRAASTGNLDVGGLVGRNFVGTVTASYATGRVTGSIRVGGLVGNNESSTVTDSYYDGNTSGRSFGIGADDDDNDNTVDSGETNSLPGRTTAQLRQPTGYTGIIRGLERPGRQ